MKIASEEVKIEMCNRILFYPTAINEPFDFNEAYQKSLEQDLPTEDVEIKKFWMIGCHIKNKVLDFMITKDLIEILKGDVYVISKYGIGIRRSGGYSPIEKSFISNNKLNGKRFKKSLIKFLKKSPIKRANISDLVNTAINGNNEIKDAVKSYLVYLRDIGVIEIKDNPEMPQFSWWGDFEGHNPQAGGMVTELWAALTKEKRWIERNPLLHDFIVITSTATLSLLVGLLLQQLESQQQRQQYIQQQSEIQQLRDSLNILAVKMKKLEDFEKKK